MSLSSFRAGGRKFSLPKVDYASFSKPVWATSGEFVSKKSVFVARCAKVESIEEAFAAIKDLFDGNKKIARATHNMLAYRINVAGQIKTDSDDDGEAHAGSKVLGVLEATKAENAVVVVTRWYGGVKLGSERFRLITTAAKEAVSIAGLCKDESKN